ncbi:MAG: MFS transporter [Methanosarcinaceae archaeon]|nr:MFS transporter [Methanosarcinaceae archaeon]
MGLFKLNFNFKSKKSAIDFFFKYRWIIFLILLIAYFFVYFHRISTSVLGRSITDDLGGSVALLSSVYFWTYTAMQIPSGLLTDKYGPRLSVTVFLLIATIGTFITAVGTSFSTILIGKALIGAGLAVVYIPLMKIIAVWFKKSEFASLNGVVIAVGNIGAIVAGGPLALLNDAIGWRDVFLILGSITLCIVFLVFLLIRDHPKELNLPGIEQIEFEQDGIPIVEKTDAKIPVLEGLKIIFKSGKKFWMPTLAYFLIFGSIMVYQGTWVKIYFENTYPMWQNVAWMVTSIGIGKTITSFSLGFVTDRIFHSKRKVMIFGVLGYTAVWFVIWFFSDRIPNYNFWLLINFLFGFFGGFMSVSFAQVKEWFPIAISGTVIAGMNLFLFGGAAIITSVSNFMVTKDSSAAEFQSFWFLMMILSFIALVLVYLSVEKPKNNKNEMQTK